MEEQNRSEDNVKENTHDKVSKKGNIKNKIIFAASISSNIVLILSVIFYFYPNLRPIESTNILLNGASVPGPSRIVDIGFTAPRHTCVIEWTGIKPLNFVVKLQGSIDGEIWGDLVTPILKENPFYFSVVNMPTRYLRGYLERKNSGSEAPNILLKCTSISN